MKAGKTCLVFILLALLSACSSSSVDTRRQYALNIAQEGGFQPFWLREGRFGLYGFYKKGHDHSQPIIYIEGDGFAWIDRYTISHNPTPRNPIALKLAVKDTSPTVFYLGRPCQFVDLKTEPNCDSRYWTNARFSKGVIRSYDLALTQLRKKFHNDGFHLVGFSGGGAIVTLLAAERDDIYSIRTIAGNLDHVTLNARRKVSPLTGSLDPMKIVSEIKNIPQIHYFGGEDKVIPAWVATNFVRAGSKSSCVSSHLVSGASHMSGWEQTWQMLHKQIPEC